MIREETMKNIYDEAYQYILKIKPDSITEDRLEDYFVGDNKDYKNMRDVFERFIVSGQNYRGMNNIINYEKRKELIDEILWDLDIGIIKEKKAEELFDLFRDKFRINNQDSKNNSWKKWSRTIVDSAKFLFDFKDKNEFDSFVKAFDDDRRRAALPLLIDKKIKGIGFALACDILKELGYLYYSKPDTHIIYVFKELGLSDDDPFAVFEALGEMASYSGVTPYKVDKVLWLICTGNFYLDKKKVGTNREKFVELCKKKVC